MDISDELRQLVDQAWPARRDSDPVRVTTGALPAGYRTVERYAVVPDPRRARFLVPLSEGRAAAAASLACFNGLRSPKVRLTRAALALTYRSGLAPAVLRHRLNVGVATDLSAEESADHLLSAHLARVLGVRRLACGMGVRPLDPNSKPTLQLFGMDGAPLGYAKIGWNAATRALTATEAEATALVSKSDRAGLRAPAVLHHGPWRDHLVTVTAPLPLGVRRHRDPDALPDPRILLEIAGGSGIRTTPLTESVYWRRLRDEIDLLRGDGDERRLAGALSSYVDSLAARYGTTELQLGRWHGDWVPWNIGWHGGQPHVWDWEHSAPEAPVGFDLLHWRFQVALVLRGQPLAAVAAAVKTAARDELGALGVPDAHRLLVARLYLIEMFVRTYRLKRGGGGWNPALYPALFDVIDSLNEKMNG